MNCSTLITLLLLICFLQKGGRVEALDSSVPAVRNHERTHNDGIATKRVKVTRENGKQRVKSTIGDSSGNREHSRTHSSKEKRAAPKIQVSTHTTTTATAARTEERSDGNTYHGRSEGKSEMARTHHYDGGGAAERTDDSSAARTKERIDGNTSHGRGEGKSERTRVDHHSGGGIIERTNSSPSSPTRSSHDVDKRENGHSRTRDGSITSTECRDGAKCNRNGGNDENDTKSDSRTHQSKEERHDHHSSIGKVVVHERSPPKNASNRPPSEERTGGGEEEERPVVQAKTGAHPIGLISTLEGKAAESRSSVDLHPRELYSTSTSIIILSAFGGFAGVMLILFCIAEICGRRREKKADSIRLIRVFQYLHNYESDDIDIQLSATGGFHVGYQNELAQGINKKHHPKKQTSKKKSIQEMDTSSDSGSENSTGLSDKV